MDPEGIDFNNKEAVKVLIIKLLNIIESQAQLIHELQNEIQSLKDEINRLKGEKGKRKPSSKVHKEDKDISIPSTEQKKRRRKSAKKPGIKIDRTEYIRVDRDILPPDAEHKGYWSVFIRPRKTSYTRRSCQRAYMVSSGTT